MESKQISSGWVLRDPFLAYVALRSSSWASASLAVTVPLFPRLAGERGCFAGRIICEIIGCYVSILRTVAAGGHPLHVLSKEIS